MCLADYQMAKRTGARTYPVLAVGLLIGANPNRLRLIVMASDVIIRMTLPGSPGSGGNSNIAVGQIDNAANIQLNVTQVFRVEDCGTMLQGDVVVDGLAGNGLATVTEVYALPDLDLLIQGK